MGLECFDAHEFDVVGEGLRIAEDKTADYYKFSLGQWKRHRYDVKTLSSLIREEVSDHAFAMLNRTESALNHLFPGNRMGEFYFICLQDHQILRALKRDANLALLPLIVYVFTHELIHIVRFCNFSQRFEIKGKHRHEEESIVHKTTYEALKNLSLSKMDYVLDSYQFHRMCELGYSPM
jgi:hypothetical protein